MELEKIIELSQKNFFKVSWENLENGDVKITFTNESGDYHYYDYRNGISTFNDFKSELQKKFMGNF